MTEVAQLALDGAETPMIAPPCRHRLSPAQREIIRHLDAHGSIRSVEAGIILHSHDARPWAPALRRRYAAADGLEALKRLARAGLVQRDPEKLGRWLRA